MYIDPQWSPVLGEAIRWVKDVFGSKRAMRLEIEQLRDKIDQLVYGNAAMALRQGEILAAVVYELQRERIAIVNHGSLTVMSAAVGDVANLTIAPIAPEPTQRALPMPDEHAPAQGSLFDGVDEAIASARLTRPSER